MIEYVNHPKVSIIVLIYKVEPYIEHCVRSLFEQTLQEIEYIFVNDCTPDNSMKVLRKMVDEYPSRKPSVRILSHEHNSGTGIARNSGLRASTGEYVIYCDGDDWVESDMYEKLYRKGNEEGADIVMCDYYAERQGEMKRLCQNPFVGQADVISKMLTGEIHSCVWGALVKRELFEAYQIRFPIGISMWEDMITSVKVHYYAKKVAYVDKALYHYMFNMDSLVHKETAKNVADKIYVVNEICSFLNQKNSLEYYMPSVACMMLNAKNPLIFNPLLQDFDRWRKLFPVSENYIFRYKGSSYRKIVMFLVNKEFDKTTKGILKMRNVIFPPRCEQSYTPITMKWAILRLFRVRRHPLITWHIRGKI